MGDHRANIKIEMEFHGIKDKTDMWINYWPNGCCGMDNRVIEFFDSVYKRGMEKYDENMAEYERYVQEQKEKEEYLRLKKKFE